MVGIEYPIIFRIKKVQEEVHILGEHIPAKMAQKNVLLTVII